MNQKEKDNILRIKYAKWLQACDYSKLSIEKCKAVYDIIMNRVKINGEYHEKS